LHKESVKRGERTVNRGLNGFSLLIFGIAGNVGLEEEFRKY
jgi:hypothetical protein